MDNLLDEAAAILAKNAGVPLRPYATYDFGRARDSSARSIIVFKAYAERYVLGSRERPLPGLQFYIGTTHWLGEDQPGEDKVELVVVEGNGLEAILRVARTNGLNAGFDAPAVVERMRQYDARYGVALYGAETAKLDVKFKRLPDDPAELDALADDLLAFCPDIALMAGSGDPIADRAIMVEMLRDSGGYIVLWWD